MGVGVFQLRSRYHREICHTILGPNAGVLNIAKGKSAARRHIATALVEALGYPLCPTPPTGHALRKRFIQITLRFLDDGFSLAPHPRPGKWAFSANYKIAPLWDIEQAVTPDILVKKSLVSLPGVATSPVVPPRGQRPATLTPLLKTNFSGERANFVGAVCCKWTIEAHAAYLNLARMRVGKTPHIVAVVAEPLPTRIASLALGTGDIDCVYHMALPELVKATTGGGHADQADMLDTLIDGRRLRDIADLPFDLAI